MNEFEMKWARLPKWVKRIANFICYTFAAWASVFYPDETDQAIYDVLKRQFGDEEAN